MCSGAFLLAEAGLLDGRRATTHWTFRAELARRCPRVILDSGPIYVHDRGVYTSAGSTTSIDPMLGLVEEDFGPRLAQSVAHMVLFLKRPTTADSAPVTHGAVPTLGPLCRRVARREGGYRPIPPTPAAAPARSQDACACIVRANRRHPHV